MVAKQGEDDQVASEPAVSITEGVKSLELVVSHSGFNDGVDLAGMIPFNPCEQGFDSGPQAISRRGRHETGALDRRIVRIWEVASSDDHLPFSQVTGLFFQRSPPHQSPLEVLQQSKGDWTSFFDPGITSLSHGDVVEDLPHFHTRGGGFICCEHGVQRSVCAFQG